VGGIDVGDVGQTGRNGDRRLPGRQRPLISSVAVRNVETQKAGVSGHPSRASNIITTESPIRTSA
jgi:hypothetical protein